MAIERSRGELDPRFSSDEAKPTPWPRVKAELESAETYWITTVRADGRPHSTPLVGVWLDDAFWFCTGPTEQKARNLEHSRDCLATTGRNGFEGIDVVIEGTAQRVTDESRLQRVADAYGAKYEPPFNFVVREGGFSMTEGESTALVFEVTPTKVLAFDKGESFGQTRWRPRAE
jgi:hypothetical protein